MTRLCGTGWEELSPEEQELVRPEVREWELQGLELGPNLPEMERM